MSTTINPHRGDQIQMILDRMDQRLEDFRAERDPRQIFLTVYRTMTDTMSRAVPNQAFLDPEWTTALTTHFATLYLDADKAFCRDPATCPLAWQAAFRVSGARRVSPLEHALLGINAHIVYDLPRAVGFVMREFGDHEARDTAATIARRRFDYEVVNHLLVKTTDGVQSLIAREFMPTLRYVDAAASRLDEYVAEGFLRFSRTQGWHSALAMAFAVDEREREAVRSHLERLAIDYVRRIDVTQMLPMPLQRVARRWRPAFNDLLG